MDVRIFTEPQNGATFDDQLALAQAAERLGFGGYFRSDHYLTMDDRFGGLPGPTDSWVTLGAIACETSTIRLGTLVSSATFRHPSILAIQVAQVDAMSGGRIDFGLGTGWFEAEHAAYGIPFPTKRFGIFEEQLAVITGLWSTPVGETFSFAGEHYSLVESPALPKPAQAHVPLIIGGRGTTKTPALAARFADEFNQWRADVATVRERIHRVIAACEERGRDAAELTWSVAGTTAVATNDADLARRAEAADATPEALRAGGFAGSPAEVVEALGSLAEAGVTRVYLQIRDFGDLDQLDLIAREVLPQLP